MSREPSGAGAVPPGSESGCSSPSEGTQEGSGRSVVLDLTSFHRSLAERRRVALQDGAASAGGELPNIAVLSNGDKQVRPSSTLIENYDSANARKSLCTIGMERCVDITVFVAAQWPSAARSEFACDGFGWRCVESSSR